MYDFVKKIKNNPARLEILGNGLQTRDYLYVEDAVRAIVRIGEAGDPGEDYNLASGVPVTMIEIARSVARLMGVPDIPIAVTGTSWPGDIPRWYADVAKLTSLGFQPRVSFAEGLEKTVAWLVDNVQLHGQVAGCVA
jgi:UDP-glucose 4-epimerase